MAHYRVEVTEQHLVTLVDRLGRRHLASALHHTPPVGAAIHGPHAVRGFAILADATTRRLYRVIFEQVDCAGSGRGREAEVQ